MKKGCEFDIRREVLRDLKRIYPGVLPPDRLAENQYCVAVKASQEDVQAQLDELQAHGFVQDVSTACPAMGPHYKITGSGMDQINRMAALSPVVWGSAAL